MKDLIQYIAEALVDSPEHVSVAEVEGNQTSVLELKVSKEGPRENHRQTGPDGPSHENNPERGIGKSKKTDRT